MSLRRLSREIAFQVLYRFDLNEKGGTPIPTGAEFDLELKKHFEHFHVEESARDFARLLIAGVLENRIALDEKIEKQSAHWRVARMPAVDRNLLRMGAFELLFVPDTPRAVVLDEAVELAKRFGNQDSPSFINGVLDALTKLEAAP